MKTRFGSTCTRACAKNAKSLSRQNPTRPVNSSRKTLETDGVILILAGDSFPANRKSTVECFAIFTKGRTCLLRISYTSSPGTRCKVRRMSVPFTNLLALPCYLLQVIEDMCLVFYKNIQIFFITYVPVLFFVLIYCKMEIFCQKWRPYTIAKFNLVDVYFSFQNLHHVCHTVRPQVSKTHRRLVYIESVGSHKYA